MEFLIGFFCGAVVMFMMYIFINEIDDGQDSNPPL